MSARILAVEDAEDFRRILRLTLEHKGHQVTTAGDGAEALEVLKDAQFDLIISDIEMPVMNGLELVRRFRAGGDTTTPILMLTAEKSDIVDQALAAGANGYIAKPFSPIKLLDEIEKYLG